MSDSELIPVSGYECPHCLKFYKTRRWGEPHVKHCWRNNNREPNLGEITTVGTLYRSDEPWHPGEAGCCYTEDGWQKVPGFMSSEWGDEEWPEITCPGTGTSPTYGHPGDPLRRATFNRLSKAERIQYWDALQEQHGGDDDDE